MKQKSGFTLIQMSIVLVIIGLLGGAILVGQNLINAAAITAQIAQINKYQQAVISFQTKYNGYLPGDIPTSNASQFGFNTYEADGTYGNRDGNGYLDAYTSGHLLEQSYGETLLFWQDLSTAGLIDGTFPNNGAAYGFTPLLTLSPGTSYIGDYFPSAKLGNGNFVYVYDGGDAKYHPSGPYLGGGNWYGVSAMTSVAVNGAVSANPGISVMQAYNIDKKIDDGIPNSGSVQAIYQGDWQIYTGSQSTDSPTSCYNTTSNTYSISINGGAGVNCALSFQFQTQ